MVFSCVVSLIQLFFKDAFDSNQILNGWKRFAGMADSILNNHEHGCVFDILFYDPL